jgi:hypothetical protein
MAPGREARSVRALLVFNRLSQVGEPILFNQEVSLWRSNNQP